MKQSVGLACFVAATAAVSSASATSRLHTGFPVLAVGQTHMLFVKPDGNAYGWGDNAKGQVGDGTSGNVRGAPTTTHLSSMQVSAGDQFSLALDETGIVSTWGSNASCRLGTSGPDNPRPTQIIGGARTAVAGRTHVIAIDGYSGNLIAWGDNSSGQLGIGSIGGAECTPNYTAWTTGKWLDVGAGDQFSVGLRADGTLWAWGLNSAMQLGLGASSASKVSAPTRVSNAHWQSFSVGGSHVLAIKDDGTLWGWGSNDKGQLGLDPKTGLVTVPTPRQISTLVWRSVAAGDHHSLALRADGALYALGDNSAGQLGINKKPTSTASVFALTAVDGSKGWHYISARSNLSAGVTGDGAVLTWGANNLNQGGNSAASPVVAPSAIFGNAKPGFLAAQTEIRSDGTISQWTTGTAPKKLGGVHNQRWIDVAYGSGGPYRIAVKVDGTLWGWGTNNEGAIGIPGVEPPVTFAEPVQATGANWLRVVASITSSFGLKADGTLWAWGENDENGKLGTGNTSIPNGPKQIGIGQRWVAVAAGGTNGFAISSDGTLWGWGDDSNGQVGDGRSGQSLYVLSPIPTATGIGGAGTWIATEGGLLGMTVEGTVYNWGFAAPSPVVVAYQGALLAYPSYVRDVFSTVSDPDVVINLSGGRGIYQSGLQLTLGGNIESVDSTGHVSVIGRVW